MGMLKRLSLTPSARTSISSHVTLVHDHPPLTIVLTGTTGNLGAYLLDAFLADPQITKIYCLNRSPDAARRQRDAHKVRGLVTEWADERVEFVQVDFSQPAFGIDHDVYRTLARDTNLIIHNAWPVDFNRNFQSFKPSINGVNSFIALALADPSTPPARIVFISSISAASNWGSHAPTSRALIPEMELTDWKLSRTGYGQSKLLSERLLAHACRELGVPVAIARVGQLGGPILHGRQGSWPRQEWVPSLIRSSAFLRALPETLGPIDSIDWVPADCTALIVSEIGINLARATSKVNEASFYHVVNPNRSSWSSLVPTLLKYMPSGSRSVSLIEWVELLKESGFDGVESGANPAAKLVDFFDNIQDRAIRMPKATAAEFESRHSVKISPTLARLEAPASRWMDLWISQWGWDFSNVGPPVPPK